jgi:hypothetical protein
MKISAMQADCLEALSSHTMPHGEMCVRFWTVEQSTGRPRREVRLAIRALARKGLAEYHRGLMTEDGDLAGSGYCITPAGREWLEARYQETKVD